MKFCVPWDISTPCHGDQQMCFQHMSSLWKDADHPQYVCVCRVYMWVCMRMHTYIYTYICRIHIYIYTYICICTHTHNTIRISVWSVVEPPNPVFIGFPMDLPGTEELIHHELDTGNHPAWSFVSYMVIEKKTM